jgi:hypothetical protein
MTPTDRIPVILDAQTWETVLRVLAQAPVAYAITAPLITSIQQQCAKYAEAPQAGEQNGHDRRTDDPDTLGQSAVARV